MNQLNIGFARSPWPWVQTHVGKYTQPVYYIRDANGNEVLRIDGPNARERADLIMELAAHFQQRKLYNQKYGLPVQQL
jgi:hypothetical protein